MQQGVLCRVSTHQVAWTLPTVAVKLPLLHHMERRQDTQEMSTQLAKMLMQPMPCTVRAMHQALKYDMP